jgi:XTP/dITP diphosphohydrolase
VTDPERIVLASANPAKAAELRDILASTGLELVVEPRPDGLPVPDEDAPDFEGNARLKAATVGAATGASALADDSGLEVDGLDGAPGVFSARYAGADATDADNVARLLAELAGTPGPGARRARFRCVIVLRRPDGTEVVATGAVEGRIAAAPRGDGGFGYDPVFVPDEGDGRTFAEMTPEEKHRISHRGRALRALADALSTH